MPNPVDNVPLSIYRYSRYTHRFTVVDADELAVDVMGYTALLEIRASPDSAVLHTASTANNQLMTGADGTVDLAIPGEEVGDWDFSTAQYDLFVISPSGNPYAVARGRVRVYPAITQP